MRYRLILPLFFLLSILRVGHALAGVEQLSEAEFRALATEIAPKVNLFRDVWAADPKAEFYGGTSRDYLYWLKGKFREAKTKEDARKIAQALKSRGSIDVREFIIGGSDIDIISHAPLAIDPNRYGVRKIDTHGADYFNPASETWKNEINQGHIPAEKIRLSANGTIPVPELGDGVREIYQGKLSIHFSDPKVFAQTKYAKEKLNHPILLALRYLRLQAMNYYQEHGSGLPDKNLLFAGMDETSRAAVKKVIAESISNRELRPYLEQDRFKSWINGTIQKSFLSYTNQTAALELMREFGVDDLHAAYPSIEPINQYVFQQYRDEKAIEAALKKHGVDKGKFYQPTSKFFPDGNLYHGTQTEEAFRSIIFQGALNSGDGTAGRGLYGVSQGDMQFSENWAGDKDRLLRFPVAPNARLVDVRSGEGLRIFRKFNGDYEAFSREFGVDIIRYPYDADAYVVKNGASLGRAQGVYRELLHFDDLMGRLAQSKSVEERIGLIKLNSFSQEDLELIHKKFPKLSGEVLEWLVSRKDPSSEAALDHAAVLALAKKEMYRLAASSDPAALDRLAKAVRPLSMDVVRLTLDAPEALFTKIVSELSADIKSSRHRIFGENFPELFKDPKSVRLAPLLDKFLQHADHSVRYNFASMFELPHMTALEDQMLTMLKKGESNIHDQLADHVFIRPVGLKYPKGFEAWLDSWKVSGNFEYYLEQLLKAPHLKESLPYMELVVSRLASVYKQEIAEFLGQLPQEKFSALFPISLESIPPKDRIDFLTRALKKRLALTNAQKKLIWDSWLAAPRDQQHKFASLVIPQIEAFPSWERGDHYKRLLSGKEAVKEVAHHILSLPKDSRPTGLWQATLPLIKDPELLYTLSFQGRFTPGTAERDVLELLSKRNDRGYQTVLRHENLGDLSLPRDEELLLKLMNPNLGVATHNLIIESLMKPEAAKSEAVALAILNNELKVRDLTIQKLLAMPHTQGWTSAQLLYLEKAHGWKPNPTQLAMIQTPEGKAKLYAAVSGDQYGWMRKIYLNRQFPADGKPVGRVKGFLMDCASSFAKF